MLEARMMGAAAFSAAAAVMKLHRPPAGFARSIPAHSEMRPRRIEAEARQSCCQDYTIDFSCNIVG